MHSPSPPVRTVAERIVHTASQYRFWSMLIGYIASLLLITGGIWLTQRDMDIPKVQANVANVEVSAKLGQFEFVAKNTAPGIVLILCGTWIVVATIQRKSFAKTQWADERHPGFTEVNGSQETPPK